MTVAGSPMALIVEAIDSDDVLSLKALFERFAEQREQFTPFAGGTWLHYAASQGSDAVIEYLLGTGADINAGDQWDGVNALCRAAHEDRLETARLLIRRGIAFDQSSSVRDPLFAAVVGRSPALIKLLLEAGIDPSIKYSSPTMHDMDATAFALMRGERECAEILALWMAAGDETLANRATAEADRTAHRNAFPRS